MEIKDYLHFYYDAILVKCPKQIGWPLSQKTYPLDLHFHAKHFEKNLVPILRNLSDMTEEEHNEVALKLGYGFGSKAMGYSKEWFLEFWNGKGHQMFFHPIDVIPVFTYLLKQGFDLFGLIPAGLAIDKTSLKN